MSDNSQDHGWQIATGRRRKPSSRPVAEAEESAPRSRTSGVKPAASSPTILPPGSAALQSTNEPLQPTTIPTIFLTAEPSQASYLSIPEKSSPRKSEKSSVSSSPEKDYLTAPQSPNEGLASNGFLGDEASPETEEAYLSATEQPEEALSDVVHSQASTEKLHDQSLSSSDNGTQNRGKQRETDGESAEESIREPASRTAESLPDSPDFHTRYLTFPVPEFEGRVESPEIDTTDEIREQPIHIIETKTAAPIQDAPPAKDRTVDKQKEKALRSAQSSGHTPDPTVQNVPAQTAARNHPEIAQTVKGKDTTGPTRMLDDSVTHTGRSVLVLNVPRLVGKESGSQGDEESKLLTKKAMLELPLSNSHLTSRSRIHPAPQATMTQRRPSTALSAEAAEFVPMPTIPEVSTSVTPEPLTEQTAPDLPAAAPEIAPELRAFAAYDEQRIRAMAASHPASAATQLPAAPVLHRPMAPVPARLPLPPPPPSGGPPLEVYDNETPGVPSHWIPLYGSVHGMFYDPLTKLFMGDGAPRPTLYRVDGGVPCPPDPTTEASWPEVPIGDPEDVLHVQRSIFTAPHIDQPYVPAYTRFFCRCNNSWVTSPHTCAPDTTTIQVSEAAPIRPGTVLPNNWVTHTAPIRDTGYLEAMGLTARPDAQSDSAVRQAWFDAGGGAAAVRGGPDTPAPGAGSSHPSRPMTSADLAAPGFSMPVRQDHQAPVMAPAPIITGEGVTTRDSGAAAPVSRQERRAAEKAAKQAEKQAARGGGGRGGQGSSRGGRGAGGAGAGAGQGISAV